ncbi:MAG: hypothetical protein FWC51_03345 [Proteobacteria bacterium]|nr:hypothetical protein [Pseudomonadota bacterium]
MIETAYDDVPNKTRYRLVTERPFQKKTWGKYVRDKKGNIYEFVDPVEDLLNMTVYYFKQLRK